jgi:glycosyltransferase involved in cell wall biosynthesis
VRLAFLTPLPPAGTGIADYSAEVIALLAARHALDVFHDQQHVESDRLPDSCRIDPVAEFERRHREDPYDVAVYQMGNSMDHAFLYEPLARVPGLLVLHDLVLHHARARMFLETPEARAYAGNPSSATLREAAMEPLARYRDEVAHTYPEQADRLVDVQLGTVGRLLPYAYPLFRLPVQASRVTAVHNDFMAEAIGDSLPAARVMRVPMPAVPVPVRPEEVVERRAALGFSRQDFVVGSYGLLTPEKQIETVVRAVARAASAVPSIRLLLVGPVPDRRRLDRLIEDRGMRERVVVTGRVPFSELALHIALADAVAHLRYPTARETSAALLRVLAQGRPTVVSDLEHLSEIPADAVMRADLTDEEGAVMRALVRLAHDPDRRARLGRRALEFVREAHSPARCLDGYEAALQEAARSVDPPRRDLPPHWPSALGGLKLP